MTDGNSLLMLRDSAPPEDSYSWDIKTIFPNAESWESEFSDLSAKIFGLGDFQGRLLECASILYEFLRFSFDLEERAGRLRTYASLRYQVNTNDQEASVLYSRAEKLLADISVAQGNRPLRGVLARR